MRFAHATYLITVLALLVLGFASSSSVRAQQHTDDVQSLGDILNEPTEYDDEGEALTPAVMANRYYKSCVTSDQDTLFKKNEREILCGCVSAKMSETLSLQDFKVLNDKTKAGKYARHQMLAYAYAPCMDYVVEQKVKHDCYTSPALRDIVSGKRGICRCVGDFFKDFIKMNKTHIVMSAVHYNPMTLDPLADYFRRQDYQAQKNQQLRHCLFDFKYKRDN